MKAFILKSYGNMYDKIICGIIGIIGGGIAYIKGPLFAGISWGSTLDKVWAVFFATVLGIFGAFAKHFYDIKLKEPVERFLNKKKKDKDNVQ